MSEFPAPPRVHILHVPGADPLRDAIVGKLVEQADACVHLDPERAGCMANWLRALACAHATDQDLPWSVILSDDADPLRGWQQHLERACNYSPEPVLGLTHFGGYGQAALDKGAPYGVAACSVWGGAIAYHRQFLNGLARWAPRVVAETGYPHDDRLVASYALKTGAKCALAARAIFGQPVKKSLLGHNTPIRSPKTTIENCGGPAWSARPRFVSINVAKPPELERLAAL